MYMQGGSGGLVIKDTASETAAVILTTNNVAVTGTTVEFVSAAANISGSSTSTGSFGRLHIMGSNRVGIGTTLQSIGIDLVTNTDDSNIRLSTHHATDSAHPNLIFRKSDGTAASPGNVADDEYLGDIEWHAYHTDGYDIGARIGAYVDGTPGNGDMPTRLVFSTSADASASPTARMTLLATGYVHMDGAADVRLTLGS